MTKVLVRRQAIQLRKQGKSYSQIKKELHISKSTLNRWLREYPLSKARIRLLRDRSIVRIEKFKRTMKMKREERLFRYYETQKERLLPLTKRELLIAGLFLYWGEGNKSSRSTLSLSNADPGLLKFALFWLTQTLDISKSAIKVYLHLYEDMDIQKEVRFWSKQLSIPKRQFVKPYVKKSKRTDIDQKGFGHGTCNIMVHNTILKENVLMAIKALSIHYGESMG